MTKSGRSIVGFGDHYVAINWQGSLAAELIHFLCRDLQSSGSATVQEVYDLVYSSNTSPLFSLRKAEIQLYSGDCSYDLAYTLINEILYQCIVDNRAGQAIHAAAVSTELGGILIPGKSGAGKTTLTTWLAAHGCSYLTDELVILSGRPCRIHPFTRPLSLKTASSPALRSFIDFDHQEIIAGSGGFMLPHRLINSRFSPATPPLSVILFPEYIASAPTELRQITAAHGCFRLMECYVNARNINDHGIGDLASFVRKTPIYQITYGSFDGLYQILKRVFPTLF